MFLTKTFPEDNIMPLRLTLTGLSSQYIHMPLAPFCLKKAVPGLLKSLFKEETLPIATELPLTESLPALSIPFIQV